MDSNTISVLTRGFDLKTRPGPGGIQFQYVRGEDVIERLNEAFNYEWSSTILSETESNGFIVVKVRVSYAGINKEAFGGSEIKLKRDGKVLDLGNAYKSAFINAIKKAAQQFGVGLNQDDDETSAPVPVSKASVNYTRGTETTVSTSTSVSVSNPKVDKEALDKARKALNSLRNKETTQAPSPTEQKNPVVKDTSDIPFISKSEKEDTSAADIQLIAIRRLCEVKGLDESSALQKVISAGNARSSIKTLEDLSKTEAAATIRLLANIG